MYMDFHQIVSGKHYEWQLLDGHRWLKIDNDHVIETHYCQPGAKGITINTSQGSVSIDFDKLQTQSAGVNVQRLSFLPQGGVEDVGWYFRDDLLWREYGSQGSSMLSSSISSRDVEHQFSRNPEGSFTFTVGLTSYRLDFSNMTQTNCVTGLRRNVRRRPKFTSSTESLSTTSVLPQISSLQLSGGGFKWEFMGDEGEWTEYQAHICSFDSTTIETQYQLTPQGQLHFKINRFSYTLDFAKMCQVNNQIGTKRQVRRTSNFRSQQSSSTTPRWQFQDIDGRWKEYSKGNCSISSQDIELQYQQTPTGKLMFTTNNFSYELDFLAMSQRNLSTHTTRSVRRLQQ
ncbi:E3 ubiquitin-protein ligase DTX1 isoform X2 [Echeneis naucrates]|uniref:E3 ubiquitin-protein ligase DTX1 isoform X2 n=1 Tax=Echeneis naucrates TaxID=173247 RepID=UPI00111388B7|nr:E3 ubiquitin-protein ligase DTX1-like isoform X2 [Echeneis naucrates]